MSHTYAAPVAVVAFRHRSLVTDGRPRVSINTCRNLRVRHQPDRNATIGISAGATLLAVGVEVIPDGTVTVDQIRIARSPALSIREICDVSVHGSMLTNSSSSRYLGKDKPSLFFSILFLIRCVGYTKIVDEYISLSHFTVKPSYSSN